MLGRVELFWINKELLINNVRLSVGLKQNEGKEKCISPLSNRKKG